MQGLWRRTTRAALLAVAVLLGTSAQAADNSLQLVPADAGFYSALLHNKEQCDLLKNSKAFQAIWNLPQVQMGWKAFQTEYGKDKGELAHLRQVLESPLGKDAVALMTEAVSDEIFLYGGDSWGGFIKLAMALNNSVQYGPLRALLEGKGGGLNQGEIQAYYALQALASNLNLVKVPDLVIGFKIKDTERAEKLLKVFEEHATEVMKKAPKPFQGAFKRVEVGKSSLLTVTLTGAMVPWEKIPIKDLEHKEGEFAALAKQLKQMQVTVSLGVHEGFLVLGVGPSTATVAKLSSTGPLLKDRNEFKMLAKAGTHTITDIGYTSKALLEPIYAANVETLDALLELGTSALNAAPLPEERRAKIQKDFEAMVKDMKSSQPVAGAGLSFDFLTARGTEGYAFDWSKNPNAADGSKPLTLFQHAGGNPILVAVSRAKVDVESYKTVAKYARLAYGHIDALARENLRANEDALKRYDAAAQMIEGVMKRFDNINVDLFYPALADGQFGFVIDGKWTSKEWINGAKLEKPMPMLEVGLAMGLSDREKFVKSLTAYRKLINDSIVEFGKVFPEANLPPQLEIPAPQTKEVEGGTLYHYPLEGTPLDKQFQPMFGIGKDVLIFACGQDHVLRLLAKKPLKLTEGPLASRLEKPLASGFYLDFPALIDGLAPWVELGVSQVLKENVKDKQMVEDSMKSLATVLKVLKCIKVTSSATFIEGNVRVTHSETVVKDID
jgi:hypothetical protein